MTKKRRQIAIPFQPEVSEDEFDEELAQWFRENTDYNIRFCRELVIELKEKYSLTKKQHYP